MSDSQAKRPKKAVQITIHPRESSSEDESSRRPDSRAPSLKSPRTARFAEATAVNSPIEPSQTGRSPFVNTPTTHYMAQAQPADVGFGYVNRHESVEMPADEDYTYPPMSPPLKSPLKSAMKTPGAAPRDLGKAMFSPTFREADIEEIMEKREAHTEKQQAKDVKIKTRVRMAKMMLRGVNFSCSLIVLAMLSTTFTIFNATRNLPTRGSASAWAPGQIIWPQVTMLVIACLSLAASVIVFYAYFRGGHKRAEKAAVYYSAFAVAFFIFSIVIWAIGAGLLQHSKNSNNGTDMWSWSCVDNTRKQLFNAEVDYDLVCRLQNWSLVCAIIEVVVETITISVYGIVFYRFYSKNVLRKSMAARDRARSDHYLSQLRAQSAPNTPGLHKAPYSAREGGWRPPTDESYNAAPTVEDGNGTTQYVSATPKPSTTAPFRLQKPPLKTPSSATSTTPPTKAAFSPIVREESRTPSPDVNQRSPLMAKILPPAGRREQQQEHFAAAPGEVVYEDVAIPEAYEAGSTALSPGHEQTYLGFR